MLPATHRGALTAALIALLAAGADAAGYGTIRGAEMVNVRREANLDSPAFFSLPTGRVVKVEKVVSGWALIELPNGERGYVKALYVDLPAGIDIVAAEATALPPTPSLVASPPPTDTPPATTAPTSGAPSGIEPPPGALEREVAQLRDRLAALESAVVVTPGAAPPRREPAEVAPTPALIEGGHGAVRATVPEPPVALELGPMLALAGVALLIGFLLGTAYGQRQERNRRTRVRF